MAIYLATVLFAFILYGVILPLVGMTIGVLLVVAMPYLIGGIVGILVLGVAGLASESWALIAVIALAWAGLVLVVRTSKNLRSLEHLGWFRGHYLSAFRLLTLGGLTAVETESGHPWRLNRKTVAHGH